MSDLAFLPAHELARRLRRGELSALELLDHYLGRIGRLGGTINAVVGMDRAESDALLAELLSWTTQDRFTWCHKWSVGDMLIWDNTGVLHRATPQAPYSGGT